MPPHAPCRLQRDSRWTGLRLVNLCLHTPRADCNKEREQEKESQIIFASTRPVQIATSSNGGNSGTSPLPPHAPCRLQPAEKTSSNKQIAFASTRPVQIATRTGRTADCGSRALPPHAPCRLQPIRMFWRRILSTLPPHAPCRLQRQKCTECNMHFSERVLSR